MVPAQCRQQRTVSPLSRVNAALACELGRLPEVLRDGDLLHARTFLQKCISRVDVMTNRHGASTATRCVVAKSISPVYLPPGKVNLPRNKSFASELCRRRTGLTHRKNATGYVTLVGFPSHHADRLGSERATQFSQSVMRRSRYRCSIQNVAMGFSGEPVPPFTAMGDAVIKNSHRLSLAVVLLRSSKSQLSKM